MGTKCTIIIPMAGQGKRFSDAGYALPKPLIPVVHLNTGQEMPMVVAAIMDLPGANDSQNRLICIDRGFQDKACLKNYVSHAEFITIDYVTEGQASTCLLAESYINNEDELVIGACDNGIVFSQDAFEERKKGADALIFTYRYHDLVRQKPDAHGWVKVAQNQRTVLDVSVKKALSETPEQDHAISAVFWFKHGRDFVKSAKKMIMANDRINGEFYVDQVMVHALELGLTIEVFEITRYLCWGTPQDYENYQNTYRYWSDFLAKEGGLNG